MKTDTKLNVTPFFLAEKNENYVEGSFVLPSNALSARYVARLGSQGKRDPNQSDDKKKPFLSIVTRTQGKRIEELSEVLLCLISQECMDFEILLTEHNLSDSQKADVDKVVSNFPEELTSRVRFITVKGGTRATPLNHAFAQAKGHYISILDDDDLVFDNWVENFYELADAHYGQILFSYPLRQDWEAYKDKSELHRLRASGMLDPCYCHDYNHIEQLTSNECPTCSLAFPAYAFQELGIVFDESLTTTEDWDYLMRTSFVCGVVSCNSPSSIYRIWKNAESSSSVHDSEEWQDNYDKIVERFNSIPLIFPEGMIERLAKGSEKANHSPEFLLKHSYLRFSDSGSAGSAGVKIEPKPSDRSGFSVMFQLPKYGSVKELELHLLDMNCFTMKRFDALLVTGSGDELVMTMDDCSHTGFQVDSRNVIFIEDEPIISVKLPKNIRLSCVHIYLIADSKIQEKHARQFARRPLALWIGRILRWALRKLHLAQPL